MEKVPQKRPVESSGARIIILASVAVLLLVAFMLVNIVWQALHPKLMTDADNEPPPGAERAQDGPMQDAPKSLPGR